MSKGIGKKNIKASLAFAEVYRTEITSEPFNPKTEKALQSFSTNVVDVFYPK